MGGYLNNTGKIFLGTTAIAALGAFLTRGAQTSAPDRQQQEHEYDDSNDRTSNRAWSAAIVLIVVALAVGALVGIGYVSYKLTRYIIARRRAGALLKSRAARLITPQEAEAAFSRHRRLEAPRSRN
jgi:hypothetical protein